MKGKVRIQIIIALILGMMTLGLLTWGIGKIYLELVVHSGGVKTEGMQNSKKYLNPLKDNVLILSEAKFWTCQVGVFEGENNAQKKKEDLRVRGFNAEVIASNPWTVNIGLGHSADELKKLRQFLEENGIPTVPKQVVLSERTFRVAGNGSQLTLELLTNVNDILREGLTNEALVKEKQVWDTQAGDHPPKQLERLHEYYCQVRDKTSFEEQSFLGLSIYSESQRVINQLSGQ